MVLTTFISISLLLALIARFAVRTLHFFEIIFTITLSIFFVLHWLVHIFFQLRRAFRFSTTGDILRFSDFWFNNGTVDRSHRSEHWLLARQSQVEAAGLVR